MRVWENKELNNWGAILANISVPIAWQYQLCILYVSGFWGHQDRPNDIEIILIYRPISQEVTVLHQEAQKSEVWYFRSYKSMSLESWKVSNYSRRVYSLWEPKTVYERCFDICNQMIIEITIIVVLIIIIIIISNFFIVILFIIIIMCTMITMIIIVWDQLKVDYLQVSAGRGLTPPAACGPADPLTLSGPSGPFLIPTMFTS